MQRDLVVTVFDICEKCKTLQPEVIPRKIGQYLGTGPGNMVTCCAPCRELIANEKFGQSYGYC